jgi:tetratricopeptide (TPR) repeat protein/predicted membrane-bound spermidine synthase
MTTVDTQETIGGTKAVMLSILAMFSGCCSLAYEVLYVRALTAVLGDMFYVHAALLSTFLVGIGLGSKLAQRVLRWLWAFETLTGLWALGLPVALKWVSQQSFLSTVTSSPTLTILATIGFIAPPSLLIGFSIPLFSAYIKALQNQRLAFQGIYKVYNLGAFLSILGVEFALIRYLGIRLSLATVGIINIFNGAILLAMRAAPVHKPTEKPRSFANRVILALALASMASAVFQMFFFKLSYLVFYPHRENFAIGLSVIMLGIFLGAWVASKVKIRFETFLALTVISIGLIYVNYLPILRFYEATIGWTKSSELFVLVHKFFFGCLFALAPMTFLGALIPALMRTEKEVAGESGHLLWVSSLANAAGYLVYVAVGHPFVSSGVLLALIAGIWILASLLSSGFRWSKIQWALATYGVVLVIILTCGWKDRNFYLAHWASQLRDEDDVKTFKSWAESATLINTDKIFIKNRAGISSETLARENKRVWQDVWLTYNGHPSISIKRNGIVNFAEIAVGIIPAFSVPTLDRALVIGMGTGITAGTTAKLFKTTDAVEINRAFCDMIPYLDYANFDIEHNPSAILHISDGRAYLVAKNGTYDAIISTVSAPTEFSASKIYTLDFYKRVKESLKPDGVFCTWIAAADMSRDGMMTILSALRHNFRYCELRLLRGQYYVLTSSNQPIRPRRLFSELPPDKHRLSRQLQQGLFGLDLDEYFIDTVLSDNIFDHFTPKVPYENTDDHPVLEFMATRSEDLGKSGGDPFSENPPLMNIDPFRGQDVIKEPARFARKAELFWQLNSLFFEMYFQPALLKNANSAYEFFLAAAKCRVYEEKADEAVNLLNTALNIRPDSAQAHNNLGNILAAQGKLDEAIIHLRQALQILPDFAEAHNNLGNVLAAQEKIDEAISHFRRATQIRPNFIQAYINLANSLTSEGKFEEATQALREALTYNKQPDSNSDIAYTHFNLAMILKKSNETQQSNEELANAIKGYRQAIADDPQSVQSNVRLADALAQSGNLPEATVYFRGAVELNPTILDNQFKLIGALKSQGRVDEAVRALQKAIRLFLKLDRKDATAKLQQYLDSLEYKKSK